MGEILVAVFIGLWLTAAGAAAYRRLKKDYEEAGVIKPEEREKK